MYTMLALYAGLFVMSLIVTFINMYFARLTDPTSLDLIKGAVYMLPLQFIVGLGFAFYYSKGIEYMSYGVLTAIYYPITISMGIFVSVVFFKNSSLTGLEIAGLGFTLIGMGFFLLSKSQGS